MTGPWENLPDLVRPPPPRATRTASRMGLWLWLGAVAALGLLLFALNRMFPGSLGGGNTADMMQGVGWFALLSSSLLFIRQVNLKQAARTTLIWIGIAGVLVLGYAWRAPLEKMAQQVRAELVPGYALPSGKGEITLAEDENGSYQVIGSVNGQAVRFLIDTGATDIVLTGADARAAGIDLDALDYNRPAATANGIAHGATTMVQELKVGSIVLNDVRVSVHRKGLGVSLLGMDFLRRLKSFSFGDRKLVLRQ